MNNKFQAKKAVLYARVSSDRQEREGFSIPAQQKLIREYAAKRDIKIVAEFVEAETAKRAGRKQFKEMVQFLKKNKSVNAILVEKTDRLYRNLKDYVLLDEIEGLEVHFCKNGDVLSEKSSSQDKFMHGIRVLMAKNYIDNLSEEIKKGLKEKAEQGFCPTKAPIGYLNITKKDGRRIIVPDSETAPFIKRAYELYATGLMSYSKIAKQLTSEGFLPKGRNCTKRIIELILHNPFYIGTFEYNGKRYENAAHEPIISPELFNAVQNVLNAQFIARPQINDFLFLGLFKCLSCGCSITGEIKKNKYIYYHCTGRKGGTCKKFWIREEKIETAVLELLDHLKLSDEEIEFTKTAFVEMLKLQKEYTDESAEALEKKIKTLRSRLNNLYIDKIDGIISQEFYSEKKNLWQSELDSTLIKYEKTTTFSRTFMDNVSDLLELCKNAKSLYLNADIQKKRQLLKLLCQNFFIKDGTVVLEAFPPYDIIIKREKLKNLDMTSPQSNLLLQQFVDSLSDVVYLSRIREYKKCA